MTASRVAFEWAVVRLVPEVHREEFVNVGVLLHARTENYLALRLREDWEDDARVGQTLDRAAARRHLEVYSWIAAGDGRGAPIARKTPSERFHWLTAPRSAVLQTSSVKQGLTGDLDEALARIFAEQCAHA